MLHTYINRNLNIYSQRHIYRKLFKYIEMHRYNTAHTQTYICRYIDTYLDTYTHSLHTYIKRHKDIEIQRYAHTDKNANICTYTQRYVGKQTDRQTDPGIWRAKSPHKAPGHPQSLSSRLLIKGGQRVRGGQRRQIEQDLAMPPTPSCTF